MSESILIFQIIILIISAVIHEVSHGAMANYLGDPTAKYAGRLTLNPIAHIDLWGSILIPLFLLIANSPMLIGWAKPVPYNPYNLRDQKYGSALVAIAGPGSNLLIAAIFGIFLRILSAFDLASPAFSLFLGVIVLINILLAVFNLVPIPPLDGSKILYALLPDSAHRFKAVLEQQGMLLLLFFIFFLFQLIFPIVFWLYRLIVGAPLGLF
ncbi:site-2 protease family protein [Patescibacteria group bacterium]|nr:site-2 protease family protein [Patescibacteria group bacterium]